MTTPLHYTDYPTTDHFGDNSILDRDSYTTNQEYSSQHSKMRVEQPEDDGFDPTRLGERSQTHLLRGPSGKSNATTARFTYIDEDFNYYPSRPHQPHGETQDVSLVHNAADIGRSPNYQDLEYADPYDANRAKPVAEKASPFSKFLGDGKYPLEQRIEDKKRGIGRQKYPFVVWILTVAMVCVFINELVVNSRAQGTPVSFKPTVNPMLGPSSSALINMGARFPACMKLVDAIPPSTQLGCLNNTANPPDRICSLEDICGFGGFHNQNPNQWFRFITPIFLHAGFVHILLNMFAQLSLSAQIERDMGSGGFFITYFAAGIFGNVLGGNFALVGLPSIGASGAIFGTLAVTWVDLFAHWKYQYRPFRKLVFMTIELLVGVAIGYIPYVDNFAHLGGFLMGLLVGTTFYPVISVTKRHKLIMWCFRLVAIPLAVVLFVVLIRNFYTSNPYAACSGCRYLSCFPTASNNHCKGFDHHFDMIYSSILLPDGSLFYMHNDPLSYPDLDYFGRL